MRLPVGYEVLHKPERGVFLIELAPGASAFLRYELRGGKMYVLSTYTPPEFRGRGIASHLMAHAVRWAAEQGYKIVPVCSFAVEFFRKHSELRHLLDEEAASELGI